MFLKVFLTYIQKCFKYFLLEEVATLAWNAYKGSMMDSSFLMTLAWYTSTLSTFPTSKSSFVTCMGLKFLVG